MKKKNVYKFNNLPIAADGVMRCIVSHQWLTIFEPCDFWRRIPSDVAYKNEVYAYRDTTGTCGLLIQHRWFYS